MEEELDDVRRDVAALAEIVTVLMRLAPPAMLEAAKPGLSARASDLIEAAIWGEDEEPLPDAGPDLQGIAQPE